jgi:Tol biopolymer transport system component
LAGGLAPAATTASGSRILFAEAGHLFLLDPTGGARTELSEGRSYDWSPDGNWIAFVGQPARLWVTRVDGSERRELAPAIANAGKPEWSPDGARLAFTHIQGASRARLLVVNADGSAQRLVVGGPQPSLPRWSPDGNRLLFHNRIRKATWALFVVDLRNGRVRRVAAPIHPGAVAEWSPDGTRISYVERRRRLNVVRTDGTGRRRLSDLVVWGAHSWSPDGSRIAFESPFGGGRPGIWTVAPDGSSPRRLSRGGENTVSDTSPDWSPDGAKLAFVSGRGRTVGGRDLYAMNADGSCEAKLTADAEVEGAPAWRPLWATGPAIRCHDIRVEARVDAEADRVTRNADRVYRYEVDVLNEGTERVNEVRVSVAVTGGAHTTFVSASAAGGACEISVEVSCALGALPPGASTHVLVRLQARPFADFPSALRSRATASDPDIEPLGNSITVLRTFPFCRSTDVRERSVHAPPYGRENLVCGTDRDDTIAGSSAEEDFMAAGGDDRVSGGDGGDRIGGENGADRLTGGRGGDIVSAGSGNDRLEGGAGSDALSGGSGNDVIVARDGQRDYVWCGTGRDRVVADARDTVSKDCERIMR